MTKIISDFFLAFTFCFLVLPASYGCTLAVNNLKDFDKSEYVFIGEVVGYTEPLESKQFYGKSWGLIVKVKDAVNLPKTAKEFFEIFPYGLWADCSIGGTKKEVLEKYYPINTEIRVIAKEAQYLTSVLPNGNIGLEERPGELTSIARNRYENGEQMTSVPSVFDYKNFDSPGPEDYTESFMPFLDGKNFIPAFEIRKDLIRLKNSKNQAERMQILERILYAPSESDVSLFDVLKKYTASKAEFERLNCKLMFEIQGLSDEDYKVIKKYIPKSCQQKYKPNI